MSSNPMNWWEEGWVSNSTDPAAMISGTVQVYPGGNRMSNPSNRAGLTPVRALNECRDGPKQGYVQLFDSIFIHCVFDLDGLSIFSLQGFLKRPVSY